MKLLFRHKEYDWIVDKDIFKKNDTISFHHFDKHNMQFLTYSLNDILDSEDWDVIPENSLTYEELNKIYWQLYEHISQNGDIYWLGNALNKISDLMCLYNIEGMNILS